MAKKGAQTVSSVDAEAMQMIRESGVLNPKMPLEEVMNLTQRLEVLHAHAVKTGKAKKAKHTDTFIHSHFIYKHEE